MDKDLRDKVASLGLKSREIPQSKFVLTSFPMRSKLYSIIVAVMKVYPEAKRQRDLV